MRAPPLGALMLAAATLLRPPEAAGQASILEIRGLGLPGRYSSARAWAMEGSLAQFDPESALNPASVVGLISPTIALNVLPESRSVQVPGGDASLQDVQFPLVLFGGPVRSTPLHLAINYDNYTDRNASLASVDTLVLQGAQVVAYDTVTGKGGLNEIRFAAGWAAGTKWAFGAAIHVITGSVRVSARRWLSDTNYLPSRQFAEFSYGGLGFSAGVGRQLGPVAVAAFLRSDTHASVQLQSTTLYNVDLPFTFGAAVQVRPTRKTQVTGQGLFRTWSAANSDLLARGGTGSSNTLDVSLGIEQATSSKRPYQAPIRLGFRYATLPFVLVTGQKATEYDVSLGSGLRFSRGHAGIDIGLEYAWRQEASEFRERALLLIVGVTVRP